MPLKYKALPDASGSALYFVFKINYFTLPAFSAASIITAATA
jgi:hypothetical protein